VVDTETVILRELELLAPAGEMPTPDWQQVRRRLEPTRPSLSRRRARLAVGVAAITLVGVAAAGAAYLASRPESPKPVTNGELVIDSAPGGVAQLSAVGADGRLRTLWRCPRTLFCGSPGGMSWSPDGKQLALVLTTLGRTSPYEGLDVLTLRTGRFRHLSFGQRCQGNGFALPDGVDWSSAGRWIAFTCGSSKILLIRPTGGGERVVSTGLANVRSPSWSPDGRRLVFSAGTVDHSAIYVINADGSHRRLLARGGRAPAWSPNSSLIAYRGGTQGSSCGGLRLVDANTGRDASPASAANPCHQFGPRQVEAPEWSPDGTEIAVGTTSGVYVIDANGSDLRYISSNSPWSGRPAWRPLHGKQAVQYRTRAENCSSDC
jgi:Tol biopolymer transport system component